MTTWGFIGSGNIGTTVARLAVAAGHDVVLSNSRAPETLADLVDETTTSSELLQAHLPGSTVVKGFNNIFFQHLAVLSRPAGAEDRSALAIAGDDLEAKKIVSEHLDEIGYDAVDLGPLSEGWRTQPDTAAYGVMYAVDPQAWDQGARPASAVEVAERAAASRRHDQE